MKTRRPGQLIPRAVPLFNAMHLAMGDGLRSSEGYMVGRSIWNGRPFGPVTTVTGRATTGGPS